MLGKVADHAAVGQIVGRYRAAADKSVIAIDSQFSTLMNVTYQAPHGVLIDHNQPDAPNNCKCFHTVRCAKSVLLVKPKRSEQGSLQIDSVVEAVGEDVAAVRLLLTDNPVVVDVPETYDRLTELEGVAGDPLHIAMKMEEATNRRQLSVDVRRCVRKFSQPSDDGQPYFRAGAQCPPLPKLGDVIAELTQPMQKRIVDRIAAENYPGAPYASGLDFVKDIAALCVKHPTFMKKKCGKVRALAALEEACKPMKVQYLLNMSRFIARNPDTSVPYGSTGCEPVHGEITTHYNSGIVSQSERYAQVFGKIFTMKKLVVEASRK